MIGALRERRQRLFHFVIEGDRQILLCDLADPLLLALP
jgi:hypothetical protein